MTLNFNETNALETLHTIVNTIKEVEELRSTNDRLVNQHIQDSDAIAILSEAKESLEAQIAELRAQLAAVLGENTDLFNELAAVKEELTKEQALAGQHWHNLQATTDDLTVANDVLTFTKAELNRTTVKLTEAEGKLARFRDIFRETFSPEPVATPEPRPEPVPSSVITSPISEAETYHLLERENNVIDLPNPFKPEAEPEGISPLESGSDGGSEDIVQFCNS